MNYNVGDVVRLTSVTASDEVLGRYVGEEGIYQGEYESVAEIEKCAYVRFNDTTDSYIVYEKDLEPVNGAVVETIFEAFNRENDIALIKEINAYIDRLIGRFC